MKKNAAYKILFFILLATQFCFSQVDVVYSDLVWSDEFDGNGAVNSANWFHQTQLPASGSWFNGEAQHYTDLPSNSFVSGGMLNIVAKKQSYTDQGITKDYTSARLNSKFAFKYGRVDVRAKLPIAQGTWPAIWMLGRNVNEDGGYFDAAYGTTSWPACGEIDIMEHGIFPSHPIDYIQSTLHTPSSNGNSINNGGVIASDLQNSFHVYSMNWSPSQITFLLDNVAYYTYNPSDKNDSTWPFNKEQFLLLDVAMGGIAGNIPANFNQATMQIDYVRVYQNTQPDVLAPTNFTASVGTVTSSSVELLLNANDNSGTVVYNISYGATSVSFTLAAGAQSVVIPGLSSGTNYTFTVTASDMSGNPFANNPAVLNATTLADTGCSGTDTEAQQGTFSTGYQYSFETIGTDVKVTCELLDTGHTGVVAFLWKQSPFTEAQMTHVSANIFTKTLPYVVGSDCMLGVENSSAAEPFTFKNPARDTVYLHCSTAIDGIEIYNMLGMLVSSVKNSDEIAVKNLPNGVYLLVVNSGAVKSTRKLIVDN
ncbi:MAG: glycosyl hydrolase family protein [Flavobacterium sp.]|nr:MAG: glycosyl hydrolase family protein [Flavobacterium sp.]